jgi:hypothetical protein
VERHWQLDSIVENSLIKAAMKIHKGNTNYTPVHYLVVVIVAIAGDENNTLRFDFIY